MCEYCDKSFIQATQLRTHLFHHTGENGVTCDYCGEKFIRKNRLETHIKEVHLKLTDSDKPKKGTKGEYCKHTRPKNHRKPKIY